jgi:transglutaminase-like putative cysteine protease
MLRADLKESVIMLVFVGLLNEFLTPLTVVFVVIGVVLIALKIKPEKLVRNLIALVVFGSYWFSYGKVIDPEVGLNFLTTIIILKMLEKETLRDQYMIFYGLTLLIGSGSLFVRSLLYVLFFTGSFFILIQNFYQGLTLRWKFKEIGQVMLWVLPLTAIFFFFIPRVMNPLSYQNSSKRDGEIGYTPGVNLSEVESLTSNDDPAFRAVTSREIPQIGLYWRGNTLSFTDGWNWPVMAHDRIDSNPRPLKGFIEPTDRLSQAIRVFGKEEYYFGLDIPQYFIIGDKVYQPGDLGTLPQRRWQSSLRYKVYSGPFKLNTDFDSTRFSRHHMNRKEVNWVNANFKGTTIREVEAELKNYFSSQSFTYSLSPGKVTSFLEFMEKKKSGFCSHYSSSLALILRVKGIPSRLVSGFMGGMHNKFANFYLVSQNDAHVWVEAFDGTRWRRLDPTNWIAPDRILSGGEAFMAAAAGASAFQKLKLNFGWMRDFQQWFEQWDYRFYQWLEEMDYYGQEALLEKLMIKKEWFFTLGPLLLALFMGLYSWHIYLQRKKEEGLSSEEELLWQIFSSKAQRKGLNLPLTSIENTESALKKFQHPDKESFLNVFKKLVEISFGKTSSAKLSEIKSALKKL